MRLIGKVFFVLKLVNILLFFYVTTNGQSSTRNYIPPSPQASSLGVFVDGNEGNYSGRANINIPLYVINTGSIKLPIDLNYYTGGIKSDDDGSWVGINWALNAGGVVGRVKKDKDDFSPLGYYKVSQGIRECRKIFDQEPDIFFFNFNGYSGKFMILHHPTLGYTIKQVKKSNLRITFDNLGWIITTPDGTKYLFNKVENTTEQFTTSSGNENETVNFSSAWYLSSITALNNDRIDFSYITTSIRTRKTLTIGGINQLTSVNPPEGVYCLPAGANLGIAVPTATSIVDIDEVLIDRISFLNGNIKFFTDARIDMRTISGYGSKLNSIKIFRGESNSLLDIISTFNFEYDYYTNGNLNSPDFYKRLRLVKVKEAGAGLEKKPYIFSYWRDFIYSDKTADPYNIGFYNESSMCMLKQIKFPTGGYSNFKFSPNLFIDLLGQQVRGGCRIDEIKQNDGINDNINIKKFTYIGGRFLGKYQPVYVTGYSNLYTANYCPYMPDGWQIRANFTTTYFNNLTSLSELSDNEAYGYDKVILDYGQNGEMGKTEYEYENAYPLNTPNYAPTINPYIPVSNLSQKSGLLKSIKEFKYDGSNHIIVSKNEKNYFSNEINFIPAKRRINDNCYDYNINTEWVQNIQDKIYKYDEYGNNPLLETTDIVYNNSNNLLPTSITTVNSKNENVVTTFKYADEVSSNTTGTVYNLMVTKNNITPVIEQVVKNNGNVTSFTKIDYKDWNLSGNVIAPEKISIIRGQPTSGITNREQITNFNLYDYKGNPLDISEEKDIHKSYVWGYKGQYPIAEVENASFNSIGFQGFEDNNDLFWMGTNTYNPILIVNGGHTGKFSYNFEHNPNVAQLIQDFYPPKKGKYEFSCWIKTTNNFSGQAFIWLNTYNANEGQYSPFPTTTPESLKTFEITNTGGVWKYFSGTIDLNIIYSALGNTNIPLAIRSLIYSTSINEPFLIDDLRFYPVDSKMSTYTYDPLVGMTSATGSNNKSMYYEYDNFNRLKVIRDDDKNIVKKIDYQYNTYAHNLPVWELSGNTRCKRCSTNSNFWSNMKEYEMKDYNPQSSTYNQSQWFDSGTSSSCDPAFWEDVTDYCEVDNNGEYTGNLLVEQRDIGTCSPTYNQTRVVVRYYPAVCAPACTSTCSGEGYKCVFGSCEYGYRIITGSYYNYGLGMWECIYHYEWSDGTSSSEYSFFDEYGCY